MGRWGFVGNSKTRPFGQNQINTLSVQILHRTYMKQKPNLHHVLEQTGTENHTTTYQQGNLTFPFFGFFF